MPLNILIIGTGLYVCGRGSDGYGTILPAIYEWKRKEREGNIYIAGRNPEGIGIIRDKVKGLNELFGFEIKPLYYPKDNLHNQNAYLDAIREIPKPACVIIAAPDNLHKQMASDTIEHCLHTLVVKPLAPTLREVLELIELQQKRCVYCAVEFHKRFDYANLKLKDTIAQGLIGEPLYFLVEYSQRKSMPAKFFKKWIASTNVFQYLGIHYVDIIYFATNGLPQRVMASGQKNWLYSKGIDTYDSIQGVIEWETPSGKKFTSCILTHWVDPESSSAMSDQKIKVIGTKGRFESDQKARGITITSDERGIEEPNPYFSSPYGREGKVTYRGYAIESITQFLKDVVQIEKGELKIDELQEARPTFKQAIIPTAVIEGINRSLENNGKWVDVKR